MTCNAQPWLTLALLLAGAPAASANADLIAVDDGLATRAPFVASVRREVAFGMRIALIQEGISRELAAPGLFVQRAHGIGRWQPYVDASLAPALGADRVGWMGKVGVGTRLLITQWAADGSVLFDGIGNISAGGQLVVGGGEMAAAPSLMVGGGFQVRLEGVTLLRFTFGVDLGGAVWLAHRHPDVFAPPSVAFDIGGAL